MQFIDLVRIEVQAGHGGDGIVAFRREKFVPAGGPAGGDGGCGGSVILEATTNLQTLLDFKYKRCFTAGDGRRGGPKNCTGASARPLLVKVPCGTEVHDLGDNTWLGDLTTPGQQLCVALGGKGGFGNARYLSNRNRAPEQCTTGHPGQQRQLQLELKLLAEVGLVGCPNAGKSTLIRALSAARPKVANYPFTTLTPNLGVVRRPTGDGTVFADIPGLIQGAAMGAGLGHDFLRHIQRTRLLVHLLDATAEDPCRDGAVLLGELAAYDPALLDRPRLLALNKSDAVEAGRLEHLTTTLSQHFQQPCRRISAITGQGLEQLKQDVWDGLATCS
ncbi:MAG: GTPase CgtA [Candidatus Synechococcus spongiarum 15L]|uniref:GTPase Obg n=2 Tax=Candidatus Synechococcus spongiarum TaxID=431041 RepID=A0A1T1D1W8_9SYNE|nr:MAG: GTPase CgtA [Candidatus Synechococcus spongiarum 15L]MCY4359349.1 GTPase ObgE [Cyanobacteria bacterium MAG APA_bin_95]OOV34879.1 GTPase Obg [Candidatus Synechococcus spongiarum LMB bulk15M]